MKSAPVPDPAPSRNFVDPEHPPLPVGLLRAAWWFEDSLRIMQRAQGFPAVSRPQAHLLVQIASGERRAVRIAQRLGITRQTVGILIAELVEKGVVTVERDPTDARAQLVDFSPEHAAGGPRLLAMFQQLEEHLGTIIGPDRLAVLRHALSMDWGEPGLPGERDTPQDTV